MSDDAKESIRSFSYGNNQMDSLRRRANEEWSELIYQNLETVSILMRA